MSKIRRKARAGRSAEGYWVPGNQLTFLITSEESGGAFLVAEALVAPGGGPPLGVF